MPTAEQLPPGYRLMRGRRGVLAIAEDLAAPLEQAGFGPDADGALLESDLRGRRGLAELRAGRERLVVRRFSHGGLLRWLTGTRFLDPERPFHELLLSARLRAAGVPSPELVAARAQRAPLVGWRLAVVTRRVQSARDLGQLLGDARRGDLDRAPLRRLLRAAGELVGRLHALGFLHADLNPNNVLAELDSLESAAPRLWVLDLDRSAFVDALDDRRRRDNLRRLYRHVERREARNGRVLTRTDLARFLRGYAPAGDGWKDDWRAIAAAHARAGLAHRLGWLLERALGRSRDARHAP